jgi:hypothetical protein
MSERCPECGRYTDEPDWGDCMFLHAPELPANCLMDKRSPNMNYRAKHREWAEGLRRRKMPLWQRWFA